MKLLLDFIYLGDYASPDSLCTTEDCNHLFAYCSSTNRQEVSSISTPGPLEIHARMYSLASKYDLPGLKTIAVRKYHQTMYDNDINDYLNQKDLAISIAIAYQTGGQEEAEMRKAVLISVIEDLRLLNDIAHVWDAITREHELLLDIVAAAAEHWTDQEAYPGTDPLKSSELCIKCGENINYRWKSGCCQTCGVSYTR